MIPPVPWLSMRNYFLMFLKATHFLLYLSEPKMVFVIGNLSVLIHTIIAPFRAENPTVVLHSFWDTKQKCP